MLPTAVRTASGSKGLSQPGYPGTPDDTWMISVWLSVEQTLCYGLRSHHPEARIPGSQFLGHKPGFLGILGQAKETRA